MKKEERSRTKEKAVREKIEKDYEGEGGETEVSFLSKKRSASNLEQRQVQERKVLEYTKGGMAHLYGSKRSTGPSVSRHGWALTTRDKW